DQLDNAQIPVSITQLRNLLSGTYPFDGGPRNGDTNFANSVNQATPTQIPLPNNMADAADVALNGANNTASSGYTYLGTPGYAVPRGGAPVPGRWGDAGLIPSQPPTPNVQSALVPPPLFSPQNGPLIFSTAVAPGLPSYGYIGQAGLTYIAGTGDDNLNAF